MKKSDIITFKADKSLTEALEGIPNRSRFIRSAVLAALDSTCPLCKGTGIMTPNQRQHWESFRADHEVEQCHDCHEMHLVCAHKKPGSARSGK
ncbi:MAG: CopG family transcriptional regulator [candidate division Zixibacteria bacterium]|nr:CopG family transcriptional regulator [candidate division Zixibacteria bacterium]